LNAQRASAGNLQESRPENPPRASEQGVERNPGITRPTATHRMAAPGSSHAGEKLASSSVGQRRESVEDARATSRSRSNGLGKAQALFASGALSFSS
jgi:hypothetical protein